MGNRSDLTPSQEKAYNAVMGGFNVFLTGHAGTGKSFLLRKLVDDLQSAGKRVVVAAPTGIAAVTVGGTTLHRLFLLKPDIYTDKKVRVPPVLKETDVLFIDEISMCRIDLFDYIGRVLQKIYRRIQIVVIGDFFQLPPVMPKKSGVNEKLILDQHFGFDVGGGYAFLSPQWKRINFKMIELEEVVRQDSPAFIEALDRVRFGDADALRYFNTNASSSPLPGGIYLAGRNAEADRRNSERLEEIDAPSFFYNAECKGDVGNEDKRVAPEILELKAGARIMMTVNDEAGRFYNGSLGVVSRLENDRVWVKIDEGEECELGKKSWEIVRYEIETDPDTGMSGFTRTVAGEYVQYPVKLAWAVTIHKSQGQTFSRVNLNPVCWDSGQLYVALSRVRDIGGLYLTRPISDRYLKLDPAIMDFYLAAKENQPDDAGIARDMPRGRSGGKKTGLRTASAEEPFFEEEPASDQFSLFGN